MPKRGPIVDVMQIVDDQKVGFLVWKIVFLTFLVQLADGYDLAAMSYAAPALARAWHFKPSELGPLFSASLVGMLFGAPLLGYAGDRFGRRGAIIWVSLRRRPPGSDVDVGDSCLKSGSMIVSTI